MAARRWRKSATVFPASPFFRPPEEDNATKFGMCGSYPDSVQRFATPKGFLIAFCVKSVLQGMAFSYIVGVETSIERHFKFDASTIGLLLPGQIPF